MRTVASGLPHRPDTGLLLYHMLLPVTWRRVTWTQMYRCKIWKELKSCYNNK